MAKKSKPKREGCKPGKEYVDGKCRITVKALNQRLLDSGITNKEVVKFGKSEFGDNRSYPGKYQVIHILNTNMKGVPLFYSDNLPDIADYIENVVLID